MDIPVVDSFRVCQIDRVRLPVDVLKVRNIRGLGLGYLFDEVDRMDTLFILNNWSRGTWLSNAHL